MELECALKAAETRADNISFQLQSLRTTRTSMARCPQQCDSGTYVLVVNNACLIGLNAPQQEGIHAW